ncbi:tyrosine-type recombinase/integrase [Enterococcus pallens]|uniref:Phage integrase n=1 Tax=Enterococcus pallens ATCC BAA-351 TaxID=1158607 RepID=R2PQC2_9ENTE|nr:site-specific integrase [Enterococcus pallens]EOH86747.1 phage integrase [Enterococcus pallens ATCC BAA-351]EOU18543.1 phage integrase [Enterococcus pallens ATCC BAA-351]OJG71175.1 phage integrase [Enterococcus pallens]
MAEPVKLKNGKWRIRFKYKDPLTSEWKDKMITKSTKKDLNEAYIDFQSKIMKGEVLHDIKLLDFYDTWVDTFKKGKVSAGRMQKINITRKNLEAFFGEKQTLRGVTKLNYQKWINWLAEPGNVNERGLAVETVENRHAIAKSMFIEALDMQYIHSNPTRNIKIVGQKAVHLSEKTISFEDMKKFKEALLSREDTTSKYFILTQMYTGCRYQEIAALGWEHLNEDDETISIVRAYKTDGGVKRFGPPKSDAGIRDLDVPKTLFSYLRSYHTKQKEAVLSRKIRNPQDLLFVSNIDMWPISVSAVDKYIKETCELAEIKRISSHSFRHAKSDFLIMAEADPIYIKSQLGHKEITQSYEYASSTKENRSKNKQKSEQFLRDLI